MTYFGRVTGITGMTLAIDLDVVWFDSVNQVIDHTFADILSNLLAIGACMKIKMESEIAAGPFQSCRHCFLGINVGYETDK
jgi:hypothetical protein